MLFLVCIGVWSHRNHCLSQVPQLPWMFQKQVGWGLVNSTHLAKSLPAVMSWLKEAFLMLFVSNGSKTESMTNTIWWRQWRGLSWRRWMLFWWQCRPVTCSSPESEVSLMLLSRARAWLELGKFDQHQLVIISKPISIWLVTWSKATPIAWWSKWEGFPSQGWIDGLQPGHKS